LNGHQVTGPHPERGMVFQQGALFEWMSVRRNIDFGPRMKAWRAPNVTGSPITCWKPWACGFRRKGGL
jgi:ABC-type nitrate/sulfonate/bicarbonate transport system ATPase subunit